MIDSIKYDECYKLELQDDIYTKYEFPKEGQKTITITNGFFKASINVKDIKISPKSYWSINGYDAQFEGRDANCWLCGWYGMDYDKCKCKSHFSIDEHKENIKTARRNFLKALFRNYFKDKVKLIDTFSDNQINDLLFDDSTGIRRVMLYFPHWSNREKDINIMTKYLENKLKKN